LILEADYLLLIVWLGCNKVIDGSHFELSSCPLFSVSFPELIAITPNETVQPDSKAF
jgi:hypothetical protein